VIKTFDTLYLHPELKTHPRAVELLERIPHRRLLEIEHIDKLTAGLQQEPFEAVRRGKFNVALSP